MPRWKEADKDPAPRKPELCQQELARAQADLQYTLTLNPRSEVFRNTYCVFRDNKEFALYAVKWCHSALQKLSPALQDDFDVVLAAVGSACVYKFASERLRGNVEILYAATAFRASAVQWALPGLLEDRSVVLNLVRIRGKCLAHLSDRYREDREIVVAAVVSDGHSFEFAAPSLRSDRHFVLELVKLDKAALSFAAPELQNDEEIVAAAGKDLRSQDGSLLTSFASCTC